VDDEPPAREVIKRYISQVPGLELAGECGNALEAMGFLLREPVDLLFLDIRMPQLNGNDFVRSLQRVPKIIFTTAFAEYALEGFELDVVDYLLKPIRFERFLKAVNKAFPLRQPEIPASLDPPVAATVPARTDSFIYLRADRKMVKVMLRDIRYIESMRDYVKVFTSQGCVITRQPIMAVEAMLPEKEFLRIHRSYIVSLAAVSAFTHEAVQLGKEELPVGKIYRNTLIRSMKA
jgi:DNA-binding LytR/AlgR family response regulator